MGPSHLSESVSRAYRHSQSTRNGVCALPSLIIPTISWFLIGFPATLHLCVPLSLNVRAPEGPPPPSTSVCPPPPLPLPLPPIHELQLLTLTQAQTPLSL